MPDLAATQGTIGQKYATAAPQIGKTLDSLEVLFSITK
jgi:hypothetical protein